MSAAAQNDRATIVYAEIDVTEATRAEAQARATHPALRPFWEAGVRLHRGTKPHRPTESEGHSLIATAPGID